MTVSDSMARPDPSVIASTLPPTLLAFAEKAYANHDPAHSLSHVLRVHWNALAIIANEPIQLSPIELRILPYVTVLHDALDHKLVALGLTLPAPVVHEFYLTELGPELTAIVEHMHDNCSWSKRAISTPAKDHDVVRKILQDADWVEAVGTVGLERCIAYQKTLGTQPEDVPRGVCTHIREKLLKIYDALNYDASRRLSQEHGEDPLRRYLVEHEKDSS
ncbi:hypothetical protein HKX48_004735 [Thoreauomyces humboldtii]|nr:hypothetical protein HKX48_004735 [Thoreauomyces humboldtii]